MTTLHSQLTWLQGPVRGGLRATGPLPVTTGDVPLRWLPCLGGQHGSKLAWAEKQRNERSSMARRGWPRDGIEHSRPCLACSGETFLLPPDLPTYAQLNKQTNKQLKKEITNTSVSAIGSRTLPKQKDGANLGKAKGSQKTASSSHTSTLKTEPGRSPWGRSARTVVPLGRRSRRGVPGFYPAVALLEWLKCLPPTQPEHFVRSLVGASGEEGCKQGGMDQAHHSKQHLTLLPGIP